MTKINKTRKDLTLSESTVKYVDQYIKDIKEKEKRKISFSAALDEMVDFHKRIIIKEDEKIADIFIDKFEKKYGGVLSKTRIASIATDINIQVIMELLNSMVINLEIEQTYLTDISPSDILIESRQKVKDRITHLKQVSDDKKSKLIN